ncbi:MAG: Hsp20/alpha crystallin family protein [Bacteroidota bacterium]|nr:Hsp20/alpha crystallin family protein [Bacteroidota bacterium]
MSYLKFAPQRKAYSPFFSNVIPAFFDEAFSGRETAAFVPAVNISEDEKGWHIEVSAAGFKKEDFKLRLENETLTISAEHKEEASVEGEKQKKYSRREFRYGSFARTFRLPKELVNEESINAVYENGILMLSIPKKEMVKKEMKEIKIS